MEDKEQRVGGRGTEESRWMVLAWAGTLKAMQGSVQDYYLSVWGQFCSSLFFDVEGHNLNECIWICLGSRYFYVTSLSAVTNIFWYKWKQNLLISWRSTHSWTKKSFRTFAYSKFDCGQRLNVENSIMCWSIWFSVIFITWQYVVIAYYYILIIVLKYFVKMAIKSQYLESVFPSHEELTFFKNYRLGTFYELNHFWLRPCFLSVACSMHFEAQ